MRYRHLAAQGFEKANDERQQRLFDQMPQPECGQQIWVNPADVPVLRLDE